MGSQRIAATSSRRSRASSRWRASA
jgi:hypothetical protein